MDWSASLRLASSSAFFAASSSAALEGLAARLFSLFWRAVFSSARAFAVLVCSASLRLASARAWRVSSKAFVSGAAQGFAFSWARLTLSKIILFQQPLDLLLGPGQLARVQGGGLNRQRLLELRFKDGLVRLQLAHLVL